MLTRCHISHIMQKFSCKNQIVTSSYRLGSRGHDFKFRKHVLLVGWLCGDAPLSMGHDMCHFPILALATKEFGGSKLGPNISTPFDFLNSTQKYRK